MYKSTFIYNGYMYRWMQYVIYEMYFTCDMYLCGYCVIKDIVISMFVSL